VITYSYKRIHFLLIQTSLKNSFLSRRPVADHTGPHLDPAMWTTFHACICV